MSSRKRKPTSARQLFKSPKKARTGTSTMATRTPFPRNRVQLGRGPIPNSIFVWLRYVDGKQSNGISGDHVWNLNSIFDPDRTGTGHQPLGRDQYATFYNRYRVWKVRAKVIFASLNTSANPIVCGLLADNQGTTHSDIRNAFEQAGATHTTICGGNKASYIKTYDLPTIAGVTKGEYKDDRYQATLGSDPSEVIGLHCLHSDVVNGAVPSGQLEYHVELNYYVELFDHLALGGS